MRLFPGILLLVSLIIIIGFFTDRRGNFHDHGYNFLYAGIIFLVAAISIHLILGRKTRRK